MNIEEFFLWGLVGINCILIIMGFTICIFTILLATGFSITAFYITIKEYLEMFDK